MKQQHIQESVRQSCRKIAPMWPLKNFVAVNPYLGLTNLPFNKAARLLAERSSIRMTLPVTFYLDQYNKGEITQMDLQKALKLHGRSTQSIAFLQSLQTITDASDRHHKLLTVAASVDSVFDRECKEQMIDSISQWAASYFDRFQAIWKNETTEKDLYRAWRKEAIIDLSPEILGIKRFRKSINALPEDCDRAIEFVLNELCVDPEDVEAYTHALLLQLMGWSSYISGVDWNNGLYSTESDHLVSFLAILLSWEYALYASFGNREVVKNWKRSYQRLHQERFAKEQARIDSELILQEAFDLAHQRKLREKFSSKNDLGERKSRGKAQAVFCIDVRSETIRRNIEICDPEIETVGFAGFFGFPIEYRAIGQNEGRNQCPVLIPSGPVVQESDVDPKNLGRKMRRSITKDQFVSTWKHFKSGAVSSFSYVSPVGLSFLPKLLWDSYSSKVSLSRTRTFGNKQLEAQRNLDLSGIPLEEKIEMAANALRVMGLKDRIAPWVFIIGHGSSSKNNPHATGLECGACGGHSGEVNALTAVAVFNDPKVRAGLRQKSIFIPDDTLFVAGLHTTTSDEITLFENGTGRLSESKEFRELKQAFSEASKLARGERSRRFRTNNAPETTLIERGLDWSQVRPEWGLAGCNTFVVAPRARTQQLNLEGKSFLHNYDWREDDEGSILETIMTAPMIVTSWINLQYYASVTDNQHYGSGNKTLHNVTAGIGVIEGSGGDLRTGLPIQSVHDGEAYQHLPQRLSVLIEAPIEMINEILEKHKSVRELCDNAWISLFAINEEGALGMKYTKDLKWEELNEKKVVTNTLQTV